MRRRPGQPALAQGYRLLADHVEAGADAAPPEQRVQAEQMLAAMPMMPPSDIAEAVLEFIRDDSLAGEVMSVIYGGRKRLVDPPVRFTRDPAQTPR